MARCRAGAAAGALVPAQHGRPAQRLARPVWALDYQGHFPTSVTDPQPMGKVRELRLRCLPSSNLSSTEA